MIHSQAAVFDKYVCLTWELISFWQGFNKAKFQNPKLKPRNLAFITKAKDKTSLSRPRPRTLHF